MLTRDDIIAAFVELDAVLHRTGTQAEVVLVGGAALALLLSARASTKDVDVIRTFTTDTNSFRKAVEEVAHHKALPNDWLNDRATAFAMGVLEGDEVWAGKNLHVKSAGFAQLVAMKLSALRDQVDFEDARQLLQHIPGGKEEVWSRIQPYLVPGMEDWKRQNFEYLWEEIHGPSRPH